MKKYSAKVLSESNKNVKKLNVQSLLCTFQSPFVVRFIILIFIVSFNQMIFADTEKTLLFLDNSASNDTYIPSNKENQIEGAYEFAVGDLKKKFPTCRISFRKLIERSGQLNVFKQYERIKSELKPNKAIIIGLIHSSEAILAAKAFSDSDFQVLSSGATTENLNDINSNFYTLANPVSSFTDLISKFIREKKYKSVLALVPGNSGYAKEFSVSLGSKLKNSKVLFDTIEFNTSNVENDLKKYYTQIKTADLIFTPGFIQQSLAAVSVVSNVSESKPILGTPNWGRSIPDLINFYAKLQIKKNLIYFPISWTEGETTNSNDLEKRFKQKYKVSPMGTAVYTYDAAIIAGNYLCSHTDVRKIEFEKYLTIANFQKQTARNYINMISGHMKSKISMVEFKNGHDLVLIDRHDSQRLRNE